MKKIIAVASMALASVACAPNSTDIVLTNDPDTGFCTLEVQINKTGKKDWDVKSPVPCTVPNGKTTISLDAGR